MHAATAAARQRVLHRNTSAGTPTCHAWSQQAARRTQPPPPPVRRRAAAAAAAAEQPSTAQLGCVIGIDLGTTNSAVAVRPSGGVSAACGQSTGAAPGPAAARSPAACAPTSAPAPHACSWWRAGSRWLCPTRRARSPHPQWWASQPTAACWWARPPSARQRSIPRAPSTLVSHPVATCA